jgi:ERCC4-type nuclease
MLLKRFGSIAKVAQASVAELREVDGVGPKRAEQIWVTLNGFHFNNGSDGPLTITATEQDYSA